ncbi:AP2/B3-like transcriptional factor family protein, partial [Prunus dulcis]
TAPPELLFTAAVFGPPPPHPATTWGGTGPKRTVPSSSFHPDNPSHRNYLCSPENAKIRPNLTKIQGARSPPPAAISGDQGLTWRRLSGVETDPIRGVGCTGVEILGNVQFIGELCRNFGRESRSLVSGPGIGVMSEFQRICLGFWENSGRVLS